MTVLYIPVLEPESLLRSMTTWYKYSSSSTNVIEYLYSSVLVYSTWTRCLVLYCTFCDREYQLGTGVSGTVLRTCSAYHTQKRMIEHARVIGHLSFVFYCARGKYQVLYTRRIVLLNVEYTGYRTVAVSTLML